MAMRLLNPASIVQAAIPSIFKNVPKSFLSETMEVFESNAKTSYSIFSKVPGLEPVMPAGAMYIMVRVKCFLFCVYIAWVAMDVIGNKQ